MSLALVDEHAVRVTRDPEEIWDALWAVLVRSFGGSRRSRAFGRLVGIREIAPLTGFRVADEDRGRRLVLEGEHRFSRYRLTFRLADETLSATTHALFPGPHGRLYRALIIPTGFHARVVKRILAASARDAARGRPPAA